MKITSKKLRAAEVDVKPFYFFKDKMRFVEPYYYIHSTFAKQRWLGKSLLAVLTAEFNHFRAEKYYKFAIESGRVKLNGEVVECGRLMKNSDLLEVKK
jgi:tRNA pseudouridine32 synthase